MEFPFDAERVLNVDEQGIAVLYGKEFAGYSGLPVAPKYHNRFTIEPSNSKSSVIEQIALMIDRMGEASAKAQQLPQVITTMSRFAGTNQRLYIKVDHNRVEGILKVGEKTIFYRDFSGKIKELNPICVLDFYVHESCQRSGLGNTIFKKFLDHENVKPNKLAYDRPSPKLLKFLDKHYNLTAYVPQNNNFVIYEAYWRPYEIPQKVQRNTHQPELKARKPERSVDHDLPVRQPAREPPKKQTEQSKHYFEENPEYQNYSKSGPSKKELEEEELERELARRQFNPSNQLKRQTVNEFYKREDKGRSGQYPDTSYAKNRRSDSGSFSQTHAGQMYNHQEFEQPTGRTPSRQTSYNPSQPANSIATQNRNTVELGAGRLPHYNQRFDNTKDQYSDFPGQKVQQAGQHALSSAQKYNPKAAMYTREMTTLE